MKILLAVSGGSDSMYLACKSGEFFPDSRFSVAHCNFLLRGAESDADEEFVRNWCAERGVPCMVKRFDTERTARERGVSIEMAARDLRYEWFSAICREDGFDAVAVAHNASDNAETFFLNLIRGAGTRGLRGMSADTVSQYGCRILRPMLDTSKEQILDYLRSVGQDWREDSSNAANDYKRNNLRNRVFPILRELNPSFLETLRENMSHIAQVDDIASDIVRESGALAADGSIDLEVLKSSRHWRYILWRLTEGRLGKDAYRNLVESMESGRPLSGKSFGSFVATKGRLLPKEMADGIPESCRITILPASSVKRLKVPEGELLMDAMKVPLPLRTRLWQPGDWMRPLGMRGRKKLSDLFVDLGWDERRKSRATVVELDGSHVAALLFARIDEAVKVDSSTKEVVSVTGNLF